MKDSYIKVIMKENERLKRENLDLRDRLINLKEKAGLALLSWLNQHRPIGVYMTNSEKQKIVRLQKEIEKVNQYLKKL